MNGSFFRGLLVGAAAVAALVVFGPGTSRSAQPTLRRAMKLGIKAWERGREAFSELAETAEDAYAEAWDELKSEIEAKREETARQATPTPSPKPSEAASGAHSNGGSASV